MDLRTTLDYSLRNAILLHQTYNNNKTAENLMNIENLISIIKKLNNDNRKLKMNYNELYFDFANYKAINGDDETPDAKHTHDSIDIYDDLNELD